MELRPGTEISGFVIKRRLGVGGMGSVYLARHPRLDRDIALKVLNDAFAASDKARAAFDREASLAARLQHPNIVPVYDRSGPEDPALWLSMRHIDGGDINTLLAISRDGLAVERALRLATDAALALDFAHSAGVLHRDVKPANLLIEQDPRHGERAVLTDFGIARSLDDTITLSGYAVTFAYAAPERFRREPAGPPADIYSLGCTLFQMLTGRPPFPHSDQAAVIAAHLTEAPPSLTALRRDLPAGLDTVIATAMAKDPTSRYSTCGDFAAALQRATTATEPFPDPPRTSTTVVWAHPADTTDASGERPAAGIVSPASVSPEAGDPAAAGPAPLHSAPSGRSRRRVSPRTVLALTVVTVVALGGAGYWALDLTSTHSSVPPDTRPPAAPSIAVGEDPSALAVDSGMHTVYVVNRSDSTVSVIDPATRKVTSGIPVNSGTKSGSELRTLAVDPVNHFLYVGQDDGLVSVIGTVSRTILSTFAVGARVASVAVDPVTRTVYTSNYIANTVSTDTPGSSPISVGRDPQGIAVDPVSHTVYTANTDEGTVSVIDSATHAITATIKVGKEPRSVAVDPITHDIYAANSRDNTVSKIDHATLLVTTIRVGETPMGVAVDPSTHTVYVANSNNRSASVIAS